jgi:hypothetical protein
MRAHATQKTRLLSSGLLTTTVCPLSLCASLKLRPSHGTLCESDPSYNLARSCDRINTGSFEPLPLLRARDCPTVLRVSPRATGVCIEPARSGLREAARNRTCQARPPCCQTSVLVYARIAIMPCRSERTRSAVPPPVDDAAKTDKYSALMGPSMRVAHSAHSAPGPARGSDGPGRPAPTALRLSGPQCVVLLVLYLHSDSQTGLRSAAPTPHVSHRGLDASRPLKH